MEISAGIQASLSGRYASALFELAAEDGTVTAVESDLEKLSAALAESPEMRTATTNPELSRKAQGVPAGRFRTPREAAPLPYVPKHRRRLVPAGDGAESSGTG